MGVGAEVAAELRVVDRTGSTNDDVMRLGREGAPHGCAVVAHEQTAGKGRRGHVWGSPATGLYESVLLRPQVPMSHFMGLSAVCALGILDALRGLGAVRADLKWPNDVVVGNRKLAGILLEAGSSDEGMFAVCGVGVNLAMPELEGDMGSVNPLAPACLADAMGVDGDGESLPVPGFDELAQALRDGIVARCDAWATDVESGRAVAGPLAPILGEYFDSLPMLGSAVRVVRPDGVSMATGEFVAVDVWGRATVRRGDGKELVVASEQASLRPISL